VRTEGGVLPADLLTKVLQRDATIGGVSEESYHVTGEKLNEAISRSWNRLLGVWRGFQEAAAKLPANDFGTTVTREKWLLPLFEELHYGRLKQRTFEVEGATVPISHGWENVPIHLTGFRISIDKRTPGAAGAAKKSPHSLLQEFLNRSPEHAWGIVSNGETLRLLRDNVALTRQAFVEFDLKAMMEGEVYADFALLWMLCHQSRLDASKPEEFWLERWSKVAQEQGIRALDQLRDGVAKAIEALGAGFLGHRDNQGLRDALAAGELDKQDYYRQLLRIVYRLLFLFVAEDRGLLLDPEGSVESKYRYRTFYSTQRLRELASSRRGSRHTDRYEQLRFVFRSLDAEEGCGALALRPLGSFLFSGEATAALDRSTLTNSDLLTAVRHLSVMRDGSVTRVVDFRNLRSEELGSVYEALLEMHPEVHLETGAFELKTAAGNERKTTGSYYTPESLVQLLLDSALDPVLAEAAAEQDAERAILDLNVCDPACGSGHFLIAAAHRIAKTLASARTGDEEADPGATRKALRDVISHCIYGVDINSMAVELCKVALWMEALDPGKPLSFLEQKIQRGNSLLGATPALLAKGIPDDAFDPIEGDDREVCKRAKQLNKRYRETGQETFGFSAPWDRLGDLASGMVQLETASDETLHDVRAKEKRWKEIVGSTGYLFGQLWADAWCAAFVWNKSAGGMSPLTEETFRKIERSPYSVDAGVRDEIRRLAKLYKFFHWHLRFPDIHSRGGFDAIIGNPPWEKTKFQEREWLQSRGVVSENASSRSELLRDRQESDPALIAALRTAKRQAEAEAHFLTASGRFPLGAVGDTNTYPLFVELALEHLSVTGRAGMIVKTGILADYGMRMFFQFLLEHQRLVSAFDFSNARGLFPAVVANERFTLVTLAGEHHKTSAASISILNETVEDIRRPGSTWPLTVSDVALVNPNTKTCPLFRSSRDAAIVRAIYERVPVLIGDPRTHNSWSVSYHTMLHMTNDASLFVDQETLEAQTDDDASSRWEVSDDIYLTMWEGKLFDQFDHRFGSFAGIPRSRRFGTKAEPNHADDDMKVNTDYDPLPRYWVGEKHVHEWYERKVQCVPPAVLAFRDVCRTHTDKRTVRAAMLPPYAAGNKAPLLLFPDIPIPEAARRSLLLCAALNSLIVDYVARQKFSGGSLNKYILAQLPIMTLEELDASSGHGEGRWSDFLLERARKLSCTSTHLVDLSKCLNSEGPPVHVWNALERLTLRCEIDAAMFHIYRIDRADLEHVIDSFPILRDAEIEQFGEFRTKSLVLSAYEVFKKTLA